MFSNVTRTALEALAATQGRTQSLHTNALDEAIALPNRLLRRIARNTQLLIQQESGTCRVADLEGGNFYVERLTYELARRAMARIDEVEALGGMARAIAANVPKMRIEEAAAHERIDSGRQTIVGVNKFRAADDATIEILKVNRRCRAADRQARLRRKPRPERSPPRSQLDGGAAGGANLLELAVNAARAMATVGEISDALEKVFRNATSAEIRAISGVYRAEAGDMSADIARVQRLMEEFDKNGGRRPRILIAKMGQDGHDRGQKVIASAFADLGFDVDIGPLFATPEGGAPSSRRRRPRARRILARGRPPDSRAGPQAALAGGPRRHHDRGRRRHPPADYPEALYAAGAKAVFGPGTNIPEAAADLIEKWRTLDYPRPGRGARTTARHFGRGTAATSPRAQRAAQGPRRFAPPAARCHRSLGGGCRCARGS